MSRTHQPAARSTRSFSALIAGTAVVVGLSVAGAAPSLLAASGVHATHSTAVVRADDPSNTPWGK